MLFSANQQFQIPLFQRGYVWSKTNWQQLWEDVTSLVDQQPSATHFMGSLVCVAHPTVPGQIPQFLVIDGQQRLITFAILFAALRDVSRVCNSEELAEEIKSTFLLHTYKKDYERFKVLPRLRERQAFFDLLEERTLHDDRSLITPTYKYFYQNIKRYAIGDSETRLRLLCDAIVARITFVMITLDSENSFAIFEALNGTGQKLEESDLIRNYIFMHVPLSNQDNVDNKYWQPFETSLAPEGNQSGLKLTDFYRDFLMRTSGQIKRGTVHLQFKNYIDDNNKDVEAIVGKLQLTASHYRWIIGMNQHPSPDINRELARLRTIGVTTPYPLLLRLLELHQQSVITTPDAVNCLIAIESYLIRRQIIGASKQSYWFHFSECIKGVDSAVALATSPVAAIIQALMGADQKDGWPSDDRFINDLKTYRIYTHAPNLVRLFLQATEDELGHKERVNVEQLLADRQLQIEHILPQAINEDEDGSVWKEVLGVDWERIHQRYLDTLGNLTLTGYNPELSNRAFTSKRPIYASSNLGINREIAEQEEWGADAISRRSEALGTILVRIWPSPLNLNSRTESHSAPSSIGAT